MINMKRLASSRIIRGTNSINTVLVPIQATANLTYLLLRKTHRDTPNSICRTYCSDTINSMASTSINGESFLITADNSGIISIINWSYIIAKWYFIVFQVLIKIVEYVQGYGHYTFNEQFSKWDDHILGKTGRWLKSQLMPVNYRDKIHLSFLCSICRFFALPFSRTLNLATYQSSYFYVHANQNPKILFL